MNRQKREEALRNSSQPDKPSDQPGRSKQPDRSKEPDRSKGPEGEGVRGSEDMGSEERLKPQREPGKLPLPD